MTVRMAMFPITLLLLSFCCLSIRADEETCPKAISQEDRLANIELLLNEVKDKLTEGESNRNPDWIKCMMKTHCQNETGVANNTDGLISEGYKDCQAVYEAGHTTSGVYKIKPDGVKETEVFCEQELDGGGWTVFQRRIDGTVDFKRNWDSYKKGFGSINSEYWLGNDIIHVLTMNHDQKMKVELEHGGLTAHPEYSEFWIENEIGNYKLHIDGFSNGQNNPGDSLDYNNGRDFSTYDRDHDTWGHNCAVRDDSAWWYGACRHADLNGPYGSSNYLWAHWTAHQTHLTASRMMVKTK